MGSHSKVRIAGPLAAFLPGFAEELVARGYRPGPAADHLRLMAEVSRWLAERGMGAGGMTAGAVDRFAAERSAAGHKQLASPRALTPLLDYLRGLGVAPMAMPPVPSTPAEVLIECYSAYLLEGRGLAASSVRNYVGVARMFLADRERARGELALAELDAAAVCEFVLRECQRSSVGSAKSMVTRLRALLRFLHVEGEVGRDLTGAVLSVASWRLASLVRGLDAKSVARLLTSCDRRTRIGRRDFAILIVLSRLGLRAGEVAAMRLGDINWRSGELLIRGKGSRQEHLPLPADVGEALACWLTRGRPRCEAALVFTRLRAPHGGLSAGAVSLIVRRACQRAGLPVVGAHRLRHTAATDMLRAGGSLAEVGQVLRHRGRDVTSIYAKVDRLALAAVVMPWPGAAA